MNEATLTTFTWLIPVFPLATFFLIFLVTRRNRTLTWMLSWAAIITSLVLGWIVALQAFGLNILLADGLHGLEEHFHHLAEHPLVVGSLPESSVAWLPFQPEIGQWLRVGVAVDPLTAVMLFMVPFAITMIFIYSVGYQNYGKPRDRKSVV